MLQPSATSSAAFVLIVLTLAVLFVLGARRAAGGSKNPAAARRASVRVSLGVGALLAGTAYLGSSGALLSLVGGPAVVAYPLLCNALGLGLALSPLGRRFAERVPVAALVGFQSFRLPLELVLHSWYEQGVMPVQMTYAGDNLDIVTGCLALVTGLLLWRGRAGRGSVLAFNVVGLGLLLNVMSVAIRSLPGPLRAYAADPPLLLPLQAPYTWIVSICVAGALFGHVVALRWWLGAGAFGPDPNRSTSSGISGQRAAQEASKRAPLKTSCPRSF